MANTIEPQYQLTLVDGDVQYPTESSQQNAALKTNRDQNGGEQQHAANPPIPGDTGERTNSNSPPKSDYDHNSGGSDAQTSGKIFVGGLSWDTTLENLRNHFSKYGTIVDCVIMKDRATGRSRGFGFVVFENPSSCDAVEADAHVIDGRTVEAKRAVPKENMNAPPPPVKTKKIFVGGISMNTTEAEFKSYFEQFGTVVDAQIMVDRDTGRPRGFGFITFDTESAVDKVFAYSSIQELNGKNVEIKRAEPKQPPSTLGNTRGMQGGRPNRNQQYNNNNNNNFIASGGYGGGGNYGRGYGGGGPGPYGGGGYNRGGGGGFVGGGGGGYGGGGGGYGGGYGRGGGYDQGPYQQPYPNQQYNGPYQQPYQQGPPNTYNRQPYPDPSVGYGPPPPNRGGYGGGYPPQGNAPYYPNNNAYGGYGNTGGGPGNQSDGLPTGPAPGPNAAYPTYGAFRSTTRADRAYHPYK